MEMLQNLQMFAKFQNFQLDNLVDFEKCCKTHIFLQKSVPIQPKTSNIFPKSCQKLATTLRRPRGGELGRVRGRGAGRRGDRGEGRSFTKVLLLEVLVVVGAHLQLVLVVVGAQPAETSESVGWQKFGKMLLVFGCIGSDFCK